MVDVAMLAEFDEHVAEARKAIAGACRALDFDRLAEKHKESLATTQPNTPEPVAAEQVPKAEQQPPFYGRPFFDRNCRVAAAVGHPCGRFAENRPRRLAIYTWKNWQPNIPRARRSASRRSL